MYKHEILNFLKKQIKHAKNKNEIYCPMIVYKKLGVDYARIYSSDTVCLFGLLKKIVEKSIEIHIPDRSVLMGIGAFEKVNKRDLSDDRKEFIKLNNLDVKNEYKIDHSNSIPPFDYTIISTCGKTESGNISKNISIITKLSNIEKSGCFVDSIVSDFENGRLSHGLSDPYIEFFLECQPHFHEKDWQVVKTVILFENSLKGHLQIDSGMESETNKRLGDFEFVNEVKLLISANSYDSSTVMALLNCKNVTTLMQKEKTTQGERMRARINGEYAPFEYYVLEINPLSAKSRNDTDESDPTGIKHRMHLCRGHFSTYTEDKPLFGKYVGRYWIPAHVRGSAELGVIDKDYRVKLDTP